MNQVKGVIKTFGPGPMIIPNMVGLTIAVSQQKIPLSGVCYRKHGLSHQLGEFAPTRAF